MKRRVPPTRDSNVSSSPVSDDDEPMLFLSGLTKVSAKTINRFPNASSAPTTPSMLAAGIGSDNLKEIANTFVIVNEHPVDDISLNFFYKPHTITLLAVSVLAVMYFAFVRYVNHFQTFYNFNLCLIILFIAGMKVK